MPEQHTSLDPFPELTERGVSRIERDIISVDELWTLTMEDGQTVSVVACQDDTIEDIARRVDEVLVDRRLAEVCRRAW